MIGYHPNDSAGDRQVRARNLAADPASVARHALSGIRPRSHPGCRGTKPAEHRPPYAVWVCALFVFAQVRSVGRPIHVGPRGEPFVNRPPWRWSYASKSKRRSDSSSWWPCRQNPFRERSILCAVQPGLRNRPSPPSGISSHFAGIRLGFLATAWNTPGLGMSDPYNSSNRDSWISATLRTGFFGNSLDRSLVSPVKRSATCWPVPSISRSTLTP